MTASRAVLGAAIGLVSVLVVTVVAIVVVTPWSPLPGQVPGGAVEPSAARDFSAAEIARENAFHAAIRPPAYLGMALSLVVLLVLALSPWGARLVGWAWPGEGGWWPLRLLAGTVVVTGVVRLVTLPTSALAQRASKHYGISTQSWGAWLLDLARGYGLSAAATFAGLAMLVLLARRWPTTWWIPASALAAAAVVLISFLYPVVVEPIFNRFTPMQDGALRTSLMELARKDGLPVHDVLVADASRRTTALNAYVSGFGATRRIVVYDTLLEQATPDEVRLVVAHELGHAKRNDVLTGTALGALGAAAGVMVLYLVLATPWFRRRAGVGIEGAGDVRAIALILATVAVCGLFASPVQNLVSRRIEARADVHALDLTQDPTTFIAMQRRLALANLSDLDPSAVVYGLFATHPTPPERIAVARSWARQHDRPDELDRDQLDGNQLDRDGPALTRTGGSAR